MADDQTPPKPRPRRRRTDIDPNAPSPPVAHERRRRKGPTPEPSKPDWPLAASTLADPVMGSDAELVDEPVDEAVADRLAGPVAIPQEVESPQPTDWPVHDASTAFHLPGLAGMAAEAAPVTTADRPSADADDMPSALPESRPSWLTILDDRSPDPDVCPFLRSTGERGLTAPIELPDPANRCAALTEPVPQSLRQQELVCLTTGHVNCPRYLRGAAVMTETPTPVVREGRAMSPAMLGSLVVLVMAVTASVAFVLARGGSLSIAPTGSPDASVAVLSPSPASVAPASPTAVAEVTPTPVPTPSPTPSPTATPSPSPSPSPSPTRTPRPAPTSDRYQLLRACPNTPRCYIYTVRRGDNVYSIARYFGVSQDSIYARNPWLRNTGLRAGQELRLPPPTR